MSLLWSYRGYSWPPGWGLKGWQHAPCWAFGGLPPFPSLCPALSPGVGSSCLVSEGRYHHCTLEQLETDNGEEREEREVIHVSILLLIPEQLPTDSPGQSPSVFVTCADNIHICFHPSLLTGTEDMFRGADNLSMCRSLITPLCLPGANEADRHVSA